MADEKAPDLSLRIGRINQETGGLEYPQLDGLGHEMPSDKRHITTVFPLPDAKQFYVLPPGVANTPDHDAIVELMESGGGTPSAEQPPQQAAFTPSSPRPSVPPEVTHSSDFGEIATPQEKPSTKETPPKP